MVALLFAAGVIVLAAVCGIGCAVYERRIGE
jgi:hypothetical protein